MWDSWIRATMRRRSVHNNAEAKRSALARVDNGVCMYKKWRQRAFSAARGVLQRRLQRC
jgi:hypothetical protein